MQRFERWQPVEVLYDGEEWIPGLYDAPYDDRVTDLAHVALVTINDETIPTRLCDSDIRPLPRFEATGDELPLLAGLLAEVEQRMVNTDMSNHGTIGPETAAVNAMLRRCWAAMGGQR